MNNPTNEQVLNRKTRLEELQGTGAKVYQHHNIQNCISIENLRLNTEKLINDETELFFWGRIHSMRGPFITISRGVFSESVRGFEIQLYVGKTSLVGQSRFSEKFLDRGDVILVKGVLFFTKMAELTIKVFELELLSKCLYPLAEKMEGVKDPELKVRNRILCSLSSGYPEVERLHIKAKIVSHIRNYLDARGYIEVETPVLHPILGGANAKPFKTHHFSLDRELYLRVAPELYLKRMIIAGAEKIYEIGRAFRNEGIDKMHNPEFTCLEAYTVGMTVQECAELIEGLFHSLAKICDKERMKWNKASFNIRAPFQRKTMSDLVFEKTGFKFDHHTKLSDARLIAEKYSIAIESDWGWGHILYALFEQLIESNLDEPIFVFEYPICVSPLSKPMIFQNQSSIHFADRFELFIGGVEFANAFAELSDPVLQKARFLEQLKLKEETGNILNEDYIRALGYGLPPTTGLGIGIDRLLMLFLGLDNIRDSIFFPILKTD